MEQSILSCRLLKSAMNEGQAEGDYASQFEEFKSIAHEIIESHEGYRYADEKLHEALWELDAILKSKKERNIYPSLCWTI